MDEGDEKDDSNSVPELVGQAGSLSGKHMSVALPPSELDSFEDLKGVEGYTEPTIGITKEELGSGCSDESFEKVQKIIDGNIHLKKQLETMQRELKDRTAKIAKLEHDLEKADSKGSGSSTMTVRTAKLPLLGKAKTKEL
jgi:hypothetical protein